MMPKKDPGPSVKDKKLYEKLRDEGNSKQKAARIANAAAPKEGLQEGRPVAVLRRLDADQTPPQGQANRHQGPLDDVQEETRQGPASALIEAAGRPAPPRRPARPG
jgi:hypothetical protein